MSIFSGATKANWAWYVTPLLSGAISHVFPGGNKGSSVVDLPLLRLILANPDHYIKIPVNKTAAVAVRNSVRALSAQIEVSSLDGVFPTNICLSTTQLKKDLETLAERRDTSTHLESEGIQDQGEGVENTQRSVVVPIRQTHESLPIVEVPTPGSIKTRTNVIAPAKKINPIKPKKKKVADPVPKVGTKNKKGGTVRSAPATNAQPTKVRKVLKVEVENAGFTKMDTAPEVVVEGEVRGEGEPQEGWVARTTRVNQNSQADLSTVVLPESRVLSTDEWSRLIKMRENETKMRCYTQEACNTYRVDEEMKISTQRQADEAALAKDKLEKETALVTKRHASQAALAKDKLAKDAALAKDKLAKDAALATKRHDTQAARAKDKLDKELAMTAKRQDAEDILHREELAISEQEQKDKAALEKDKVALDREKMEMDKTRMDADIARMAADIEDKKADRVMQEKRQEAEIEEKLAKLKMEQIKVNAVEADRVAACADKQKRETKNALAAQRRAEKAKLTAANKARQKEEVRADRVEKAAEAKRSAQAKKAAQADRVEATRVERKLAQAPRADKKAVQAREHKPPAPLSTKPVALDPARVARATQAIQHHHASRTLSTQTVQAALNEAVGLEPGSSVSDSLMTSVLLEARTRTTADLGTFFSSTLDACLNNGKVW
jgi:hypothetical protein